MLTRISDDFYLLSCISALRRQDYVISAARDISFACMRAPNIIQFGVINAIARMVHVREYNKV